MLGDMALRGAGGTPGGIGQFFGGLALAALGVYLFLDRVSVTSNFHSLFGGHFGLVMVPLGLGLALLFFSARSVAGWALTVCSLAAIVVSILANLTFYFAATNFWHTTAMMALIGTGVVMMARSLRSLEAPR
jgi:hypothetical protein